MRAVGLKILKNKLSEYVRLAAGGETVLVTDRDRVVAELVPPGAGRPGSPTPVLPTSSGRDGSPPLPWPGRVHRPGPLTVAAGVKIKDDTEQSVRNSAGGALERVVRRHGSGTCHRS